MSSQNSVAVPSSVAPTSFNSVLNCGGRAAEHKINWQFEWRGRGGEGLWGRVGTRTENAMGNLCKGSALVSANFQRKAFH